MTRFRRFSFGLLLSLGYVLVSNACGPFIDEAVFVQHSGPDGAYGEYLRGHIGVPQPGYRMRHFAVAYDWMSGQGLSASEQEQALSIEQMSDGDAARQGPLPQITTGPAAWLAARVASGVPGGPRDTPAEAGKPWTARSAIDGLETERMLPGQDYESFANCLDDAYSTAARTLTERKVAHGADGAGFTAWVQGQDAVFANCDGQHDTMPADVPAQAAMWLRQDRAYQQAAASFYQMDFDAALAKLRAIAADPASPWQATARLVMARALIRQAMLGQATELPEIARGRLAPGPYDRSRGSAQEQYTRANIPKRPLRLAQAREMLRAIVADPACASVQHSASGLLDLVGLKLDPAAQAKVLEARLTGTNRPQTPGVFRQALIDIGYYPQGEEPPLPTSATGLAVPAAARPAPLPPTGLLAWVRAMVGSDTNAQEDSSSHEYRDDAKASQQRPIALSAALAGWHSTVGMPGSTPWLAAALAASRPGDPDVPELVEAAARVPRDAPAWTAVTYNRLRLSGGAPAVRTELDRILPGLSRTENRSTVNLFLMLRQRSSPTLAAFLADAGTLPAAFTSDETEAPSTKPFDGLCHLQSSAAETRLFDHEAATVLNTRMPLRLLAEAAASPQLPVNLRFQIAQATWTRAVLLAQPAIARQMSPLLAACYPAWQPWLEKYDTAATPDDREANGLLALMRFSSTEPVVRDGAQRPDGFAAYSELRDNWWQESKPGTPAPAGALQYSSFFGQEPASPGELPDPPFLTGTDRAGAAQEVAALRAIGGAPDYFAAAALAWQKRHPDDARTPDILGFAERVVRSGARTDATKELNHRLFVVVQTRYPGSEWAQKYTTWE